MCNCHQQSLKWFSLYLKIVCWSLYPVDLRINQHGLVAVHWQPFWIVFVDKKTETLLLVVRSDEQWIKNSSQSKVNHSRLSTSWRIYYISNTRLEECFQMKYRHSWQVANLFDEPITSIQCFIQLLLYSETRLTLHNLLQVSKLLCAMIILQTSVHYCLILKR